MNVVILLSSATALLSKNKVSPVEKVTELLLKLKDKTLADKQKEKVMFQKFDDYCHSQEDEKFWRAAKGAAKVDRLDREIEDHQAQIEELTLQVEDLDAEIKENRESIQTQTDDTHATSKEDNQALKDLDAVISQCKRALTHLRNSDVSGTGLTQLGDMLESTLKLQQPPQDMKKLVQLLEVDEPGQPHAYKFHSTKVIEILEDLTKQFKDQRRDRDEQALQSQRDSEHSISALENLVDSQVHKKDEFQGEMDQHTQEMEERKQDRALTDKNLFADVDFAHHLVGCEQVKTLADTEGKKKLTEYLPRNLEEAGGCPSDAGECGEKRKNYEARVKTRDEELAALDKAIELMQGDGGSKYKANKRLTALPQVPNHNLRKAPIKQHIPTVTQKESEDDEDEDMKDIPTVTQKESEDDEDMKDDEDDDFPTKFLQMSHKHHKLKDVVKKKLIKLLEKEVYETKSTVLSMVLVKLKMGDHFKDIRKIIEELIAKLEKQVLMEEDQKTWCDEQTKTTTEKKKEAEDGVSKASSTIDEETARRNLLKEEIAVLQKQIAADQEAKKQATEIRSEEKLDNEETIKDSEAGVVAVSDAIKVLTAFYEANTGNSAAFIQQAPKGDSELYRAAGEGADGKTSSDQRPESGAFETAYDGNQDGSKGVIGMLEVIKADYERTVDTIKADEEKAAGEYKEADERMATKIEEAEGVVSDKTDSETEAQEKITSSEGDLKSAEKELKLRNDELNQLKPLCDPRAATGQLAERRKRREQEVASLREALVILREFK